MPKLYSFIPNPHIEFRHNSKPIKVNDLLPKGSTMQRFNSWLATKITDVVGTMWCAYAFAGLALISLPDAIRGGIATTISWIAQTFLQLVLLSIIMVGQNIQADASDKRAEATYNDADAILQTSLQIQHHLEAQDQAIQDILNKVGSA